MCLEGAVANGDREDPPWQWDRHYSGAVAG